LKCGSILALQRAQQAGSASASRGQPVSWLDEPEAIAAAAAAAAAAVAVRGCQSGPANATNWSKSIPVRVCPAFLCSGAACVLASVVHWPSPTGWVALPGGGQSGGASRTALSDVRSRRHVRVRTAAQIDGCPRDAARVAAAVASHSKSTLTCKG
jgi:hypothetical protein